MAMTDTIGPFTTQQLKALAQFLPVFASPDFSPGAMTDMVRNAKGSFSLPYAVMSEPVMAFLEAAHDNGWVVGHFDWTSWADTNEARRLISDEADLAEATSDQLAQLLTVLIRQDRFADGSLLAAFNGGLILRIVRRIDTLLQTVRTA